MPQPLVSIVTPVFNEETHLAECIESVLAQTYQNWEYTIVDNCSTDASVEIARRYTARDRRIRILQNQQFLRAIPNFNRALRQISRSSKYCKIVLGDDWIFPECLERMVAVGEEYPSVGIVGAYALEGNDVALTGLPCEKRLVSGREACRLHLLDRQYVFGTQTSVMYRADLVRSRDLFFNESNVQADTEACFAVLQQSDFGFVHQVLTFTRVRPGSINAISLSMHTSWAALLHLLVTYGPAYLTSDELKGSVDRHLSRYYRFLGRSLMLSRDEKFWNYHKEKLAAAGVGFSWARVVGGLATILGEAMLNPQNTIARLLKRRDVARGTAAD